MVCRTFSPIKVTFVLLAGSTIPFYFESPSIFYKTGGDKFLLRSGKILGIFASILLMVQLFFVSNLKLMKDNVGLKKLYKYHKFNGVILLSLALIHPVFILGAEHFVFFPVEYKYWPELAGGLLISVLFIFVVISYGQKKMGIPYKTWKVIHKLSAPILFVLLFMHVFNVSRTFESGVPFYALCFLMGVSFILYIRTFLKR